MEAKKIKGKKLEDLTEVQVRIANSQLNFKVALTIPVGELYDYVHSIRLESEDRHGRKVWKKFSHLPLLSFVDRDDVEEVVFDKEEDLPKEPCDIVTQRGELIARLT